MFEVLDRACGQRQHCIGVGSFHSIQLHRFGKSMIPWTVDGRYYQHCRYLIPILIQLIKHCIVAHLFPPAPHFWSSWSVAMVIASHSSNSFSVLFIFSLIVGGLSLPSAIRIGISFPSATPLFVRISNRILLPFTTSPACFPSCASRPLLVSPTPHSNQYGANRRIHKLAAAAVNSPAAVFS